jgi:hypothetical protein
VPVPPFAKVTLVGLSDPETPGGKDTVRVIVPANPATLDKVIVDIPLAFTATLTVEGFATIVKSFARTITTTFTV